MIEAGKIYNLKEEFFTMLAIGRRAWLERKEDLLAWLTNFYDYELIEGRPIRIHIKEVYGEYRTLPRKGANMM